MRKLLSRQMYSCRIAKFGEDNIDHDQVISI